VLSFLSVDAVDGEELLRGVQPGDDRLLSNLEVDSRVVRLEVEGADLVTGTR